MVAKYRNFAFPIASCVFNPETLRYETVYETRSMPVLEVDGKNESATISQMVNFANQQVEFSCDRKNEDSVIQEDRVVIFSGSSTLGSEVFYYPIDERVVEIMLIITGELPSSIRLYGTSSTGEAQAKFGNIAVCVPAPGNAWAMDAAPGFIWTRRAVYRCRKMGNTLRAIRLNMKPGLSWVAYDTGIRE